MRTTMAGALGVAVVIGASADFSVDRRGEPVSEADLGEPEYVGEASQDLTTAYCILNAHTDDNTVHFEGPKWLLTSGEGAGPLLIDMRVVKFVIPAMSTTSNYKPDASAVSAAVGYSMTERYGVNDFTRATVQGGRFQRIEAYPAFQRTIWEIRDPSCSVPLGLGASYRPIGVYFKVVDTVDVALPDLGVRLFQTIGDDPGVLLPGAPPPPAGDGGTRDGGAGAAGGSG
jgi:hypothetical protein